MDITVTHTCGHTQPVNYDRVKEEYVLKLTGGTKEEFVARQIKFLSDNPCPSCYTELKKKYGNTLKPVGG